jgi:hypothetical protein
VRDRHHIDVRIDDEKHDPVRKPRDFRRANIRSVENGEGPWEFDDQRERALDGLGETLAAARVPLVVVAKRCPPARAQRRLETGSLHEAPLDLAPRNAGDAVASVLCPLSPPASEGTTSTGITGTQGTTCCHPPEVAWGGQGAPPAPSEASLPWTAPAAALCCPWSW